MKYEKRLDAGERWDVSAVGQYIGYVSGAGEVEVSIDGELHYLGVNEVHETFSGFKSFSVRNTSSLAGDFVIKAGMGKLYMAGDGQVIDVLGIRETVKTEVLNAGDMSTPIVAEIDALSGKTLKTNVQNSSDISTPIVAKIADLIGSVINIRAITETLETHVLNTVDIREITETLNIRQITETIETNVLNTVTAQISGVVSTLEKPAQSIATSNKVFTAGESYEIPANTSRRDITIFAAETNTDLVTVAGIPLAAGQYVELKNYVGSIGITAVNADTITTVEVIK